MYVAIPPSHDAIGETIDSKRWVDVLWSSRSPQDGDQYLHWDKLRRLDPPNDLTAEEWWWALKFKRSLRPLPLLDADGEKALSYGVPDSVLRRLHRIDQRCAGEVVMDEVVTSDAQARERYLVNSLTEEAIRSSQLEGATTSRRAAKELLRSGRAPQDRSERMILNNYRALQFMRNEMGATLTPEAILELHRILTADTLDDPDAAGRLQTFGEERVAVYDRDDGRVVHKPPHPDELPERMDLLCDFANQDDDSEPFIHPVIRAILLHFWLAYDHPFVDGNGRTARILFFWLMRKRGYWLIEYLPISRILQQAPAQYGKAFLETETDEGDVTYFLIHQLKTIERAIDELHAYLARKAAEIREVETLLHGSDGFNHRQLALLSDALRHPDRSFSFGIHAEANRVTHETSRSDLSQLVDRGLLIRRKVGREYIFEPAPDLPKRLKESPA